MTVEELAQELDDRWDSHYPTVLRIVGQYALIYGYATRDQSLSEIELTDTQADRIRAAYDAAEFDAGRTPMPGTGIRR